MKFWTRTYCSGELLKETVLDSIAIRWPADALAVGDGGVNALLNARADHLALGIGEHHHRVEHHLGHPVVLTDRADWLIHEVETVQNY
jgi:hypothetical protein